MFRTILRLFYIILLFSISLLIAQGDDLSNEILITNVKLFDGYSDDLALGQDILVEGNLIKKIGKNLQVGNNATVIDGGGRC